MVKQLRNTILLLISFKKFSYSYIKCESTVAVWTQTERSVLNQPLWWFTLLQFRLSEVN